MATSWGTVGWQGFTPPKANTNPFETVTNTKSPQVDSRLSNLFTRFDELRKMGAGAIADYGNAIRSATPMATSYAQSDIGALSDIALGRTAEDLRKMRENRANAISMSADRARSRLAGTLGQNQLALGGGGRSLGTGSYINRLALDKLADIEAKSAADTADAERSDYEYNQRMRLGTLGQRGGYLDALAGRSLLPFKAGTDEYASGLSQLQQLLQQYLGNNFIGLRKPQGVDYAI